MAAQVQTLPKKRTVKQTAWKALEAHHKELAR